jgi:hypothetical protein
MKILISPYVKLVCNRRKYLVLGLHSSGYIFAGKGLMSNGRALLRICLDLFHKAYLKVPQT